MKTHTNDFKLELKNMGRQIDSKIIYGTTILHDELYAVTPHFKANILKSVMKQLDIESSVDIPLETVVNYQLGLLVNENYEYLNYGNYVVYSSEKQEDTDTYKIICYDKMLYSMKEYQSLNVTYPITIKNYLSALSTRIGLQLENTTFYNQDMTIPVDLYEGLNYTYRDVLDEIAQVAGAIIYINNNDKIEVKYPNITNDTIDEEFLKDVNVKFGQKYGPINSIVLSRSGESDNVYLQDTYSIEENGLCEIKIIDNQIMNFNDRSDFLQGILNALDGFEYYINDFSSTGILYYDVYDKYNIEIGQMTYNCIMLNDEINVTQGLEELIYTDMPEQSETDYSKADKTDRRINQTYIIVDKQNQTIESVVSNVTDQNNKIARVEQTVDEINSKISDIADITISQETFTGSLTFTGINASEPIHIEIRPIQTITKLHPFENLYPSNSLYIQLRTLRFTNTTTSEVFDYILPDDLLYYDSNNYDEFILDYSGQTVYVNKKCKYNRNTGAIELLSNERVDEYSFPSIQLTDGDYTVKVLKYDNTIYNCYLFVRLMSQNIYTEQFAIKAEVSSEISQTATNINLSVDEKLTNYSTTNEMNSAINLKADQISSTVSNTYATKTSLEETSSNLSSSITQTANSITSSVAETYETKTHANSSYSILTQTSRNLQSQINDNDTDISTLEQTAQGLTSTVSQKVGNNEVISKINQSSESITINANRIDLSRKDNKYDK